MKGKVMIALATVELVSGIMTAVVFLLTAVLFICKEFPVDIFMFMLKMFVSLAVTFVFSAWLFKVYT